MYWLRWHYHVKDIAGVPYKIRQNKTNKRTEAPTVSSRGRQQLYCAVHSRSPNHCQATTEKVQSSALDGTLSATVHSWQTTADCSTHVPKPLGRHGHRALNVWWTVRPAWLCQQNADGVEYRHQMSGEGKVRRRCSMKTAVGQNAQPEYDSLRNSQPMELTKQWGYAFWPPRWENQTGGGIQDGLKLVLQLAKDTSENRVAVIHLADNQCTNQGQQGMLQITLSNYWVGF